MFIGFWALSEGAPGGIAPACPVASRQLVRWLWGTLRFRVGGVCVMWLRLEMWGTLRLRCWCIVRWILALRYLDAVSRSEHIAYGHKLYTIDYKL